MLPALVAFVLDPLPPRRPSGTKVRFAGESTPMVPPDDADEKDHRLDASSTSVLGSQRSSRARLLAISENAFFSVGFYSALSKFAAQIV